MKLSIVIPAYNEENRLGVSLDHYLAYFVPRYGLDFELIVVVNGSRDRTEHIARERMPGHPQLQVLVEPRAIGKGGAIMMGFAAARGDLVGFTDADASTPPDAFDDLVRNIGDAGAIIASRWFPESKVYPPQPLKRRVASRMFNYLVRKLFKVMIRDTQCGAKILRQQAVQDVAQHAMQHAATTQEAAATAMEAMGSAGATAKAKGTGAKKPAAKAPASKAVAPRTPAKRAAVKKPAAGRK